MKYRAEIDGLRFLAVLMVIIYHIRINILGINIFHGGFVGVDIFFVISGYLITKIIVTDLEKGKFNIFYFFERRSRRILPLLLFVSIFFLIIGTLITNGEYLLEFSRTVVSSIFFYSNYFFLFREVEYGLGANSENPFIHTWSLSIEEQYYILFPIILILLRKYFNLIKVTIFILFFISFYMCMYGFNNYPKVNFFLFSSRIWEILLGSIIAIIPNNKLNNLIIKNFFTVIGIFMIFMSSFYFNDIDENFPSYKNLYPTIGTALIIYFGGARDLVSKILSLRIFTFFGKVSFSLYMIHMPVIVLIRSTDLLKGTIVTKFLSMSFIILFSIFTYFFIEKVFRNQKLVSLKLFLISIFTAYLLLLSTIFIIFQKNGNLISFNEKYEKLLTSAELNDTQYLEECIDKPILEANEKINHLRFNCSFNETEAKKIFLIGDSFMTNLADVLINEYPEYNYNVYITSGCMYLPNYNKHNIWNNKIQDHCNDKNFKKIKKILLNQNNSIFIFNYRTQLYLENSFNNPKTKWDYYYKSTNDVKGIKFDDFAKEYQELSKNNKVLLIYPTPELEIDPYKEVSNILILNKFFKTNVENEIDKLGINYSNYYERSKNAIKMYDQTINKNIIKIEPSEFICNQKKEQFCNIIFDNSILYEDDNHLSATGSKKTANLIKKTLVKLGY